MFLVSELDARNTYVTQNPGQNGGTTLPANTPAGFEFAAKIMQSGSGGFLAFLEVVMHSTTATGIYVLLLDQVQSAQVAANAPTPFVNGDLALLTLGPTAVDTSPTPRGATIILSEPEAQAPIICDARGTGRMKEYRGFPFDLGCIAVLSSTPGFLTQLTGPNEGPPVGGARFTARIQRC